MPDKHDLSHGMCFYQVMTLHFLNGKANYAESTQN